MIEQRHEEDSWLRALHKHGTEMVCLVGPDGPWAIDLNVLELVRLVGAMQLALRHPGYVLRYEGGKVKEFCELVAEHLGSRDPALKSLVLAGFNPAHDKR